MNIKKCVVPAACGALLLVAFNTVNALVDVAESWEKTRQKVELALEYKVPTSIEMYTKLNQP